MDVEIIDMEEQVIFGVSKNSNDLRIDKDIKEMSKQYLTAVKQDFVLPYFVLSKNYDKKTTNFEMFIGSTHEYNDLEKFVIPKGKYCKITVKPKWGFLWGLSIGKAKRFFYTKWLPNSEYKAVNMEYEYHTEKSAGNNPTIDVIFAIEDK